jgi:hypothetical protein
VPICLFNLHKYAKGDECGVGLEIFSGIAGIIIGVSYLVYTEVDKIMCARYIFK